MNITRRPVRSLLLTVATAWPLTTLAQNPNQPQIPTARDLLRQVIPPVQQQQQQPSQTQRQYQQPQQVQQPQQQPQQLQQQPGQPVFNNPAYPQGTVVQTLPAAPVASSTIGTHQIDRFAAINQLQADLKSDANNLANWAILAELAHEVALDLPEGQDNAYYQLSSQAYQNAARLDPNNEGLKAAVQFARDQVTNSATFDAQRRQAVGTYLDSRRREMATNGVNPSVVVYEASQSTITQSNGTTTAGYPTRTYRPLYNAQAQQPYSYNQYQNAYSSPAVAPAGATATNPTAAPTTLREFGRQLPGVIINEGVRALGQPTPVTP